jgi:colicin import membrane protein
MPSAADRLDFLPPRPAGTSRALALAVLAHLALLGALTWGVGWKREATVSTVEAELWSSLPQQAAPKLQTAPPPPPAAPTVPEPPAPPAPKAPDIAVEKEPVKPPKPEPKPEPKPAPKPEPKPEAKQETKPVAKAQPAASSPAVDQKKLDAQAEADRQKFLDRMAGLAGASGAPNATGNASQSSGPSSGYAGLIKGRVRPNLVFTGNASGNPLVSVEVRLAPDGTVLGRPRVLKSSGNKEWDEAVVRAFEKTEALPRDGGKIWSPLVIDWRVND